MAMAKGKCHVGKRLREMREARALSLRQVAARAGISPSHLRRLELERVHNPTIETLICIAQGLNMSLWHLLLDLGYIDQPEESVDPALVALLGDVQPADQIKLARVLRSALDIFTRDESDLAPQVHPALLDILGELPEGEQVRLSKILRSARDSGFFASGTPPTVTK